MNRGLAGLVDRLLVCGIRAALPRPDGQAPEELAGDFLLGRALGEEPRKLWLRDPELRRHAYILGATGSGKTNLILRLAQYEAALGRTCVILDLRGDLTDRVLVRLASSNLPGLVSRVNLIDLREDGVVCGLNPLQGSGDLYSRAMHLLGVIRYHADSWGVQLDETLRNSLIALSMAGGSILEIEPLLLVAAFRKEVLRACNDPHVRSFFERYESLSNEKQLSWALPVLNKITPLLAVPQLRRMFGSRSGLNWAALLDSPGRIILVALAAGRFHESSALVGGLIVSSIQNAVMARSSRPETKRPPVTLFVDEFENMASPAFQTIVAEGRRFGLSLILSHQNLSQIHGDLRQVLRNNVHLQLFFQTGSQDAAELAPELIAEGSRDDLRRELLSLPVGEAYLARRSLPSVRVATLFEPDPVVPRRQVQELRVAALRSVGRLRMEVDAELQARLRSQASRPQDPHPMEVRHGRRPKGL